MNDVVVIKPSQWNIESDGLWHLHIPFEAKGKDILLEFVDNDEYIKEHKEDFDALNSGFTTDTECTITANHCPSCSISVQIKFCDEEDGEIIYKPDEQGNFKPEWRSNNFRFGGLNTLAKLIGSEINFDPSQINDVDGDIISNEEINQVETKEE